MWRARARGEASFGTYLKAYKRTVAFNDSVSLLAVSQQQRTVRHALYWLMMGELKITLGQLSQVLSEQQQVFQVIICHLNSPNRRYIR